MPEGFTPGTSLGHYRIVVKIGEGGMGEVYCARDERLDRDVAIKMLPKAIAEEADRLVRFKQEARAALAPNHPNIRTVYRPHTTQRQFLKARWNGKSVPKSTAWNGRKCVTVDHPIEQARSDVCPPAPRGGNHDTR